MRREKRAEERARGDAKGEVRGGARKERRERGRECDGGSARRSAQGAGRADADRRERHLESTRPGTADISGVPRCEL